MTAEQEKSIRCPVCCVEPGSPCLHPRRRVGNPKFWDAIKTHRARVQAVQQTAGLAGRKKATHAL